jgi:hypothetical protein
MRRTARLLAVCIFAVLVPALTACGGGGGSTNGSAGGGGGGGGGGASTPPVPPSTTYPAFPVSYPQLVKGWVGYPVLTNARLVPVFFSTTPDQANTLAMMGKLAGSPEWAALSEYGVSTPTVGATVQAGVAPATITMDGIKDFIVAHAASWGPLDGNEFFVLFYPKTTTVTDAAGSAWHSAVFTADYTNLPFAVVPNFESIAYNGYETFHELAEGATDPFITAYRPLDHDHLSWDSLGFGTEIGDMCLQSEWVNSAALGFSTHATWSNTRAAASQDPCPVTGTTIPFFGGQPVLNSNYHLDVGVANSAATGNNASVSIAAGTSTVVQVKVFSYSQMPAALTFRAVQTNLNDAATNKLTFNFDRTSGLNGDVLNLTVTAPAVPFATSTPTTPYATFVVVATLDTQAGGQHTHGYPGLVTN